jgi:2-dehydropantoate 2-reductase
MGRTIRDICIYGVGGVGGYFGGKIARAIALGNKDGRQVFFIARGPHLEEIRKHGLLLNTSEEEGLRSVPTLATDNIEEIPSPDLCLVCVKSYNLNETLSTLSRKIKKETIVLPLLNGVDVYERIKERLTHGVVLPACAYVGTHIERPGVVTQKGAPGIILCGKDPNLPDFDPLPVINVFKEANIQFQWTDDPFVAIWEKFVFIASFGLVSARSGKTLGQVMSDTALKDQVRTVMTEIVRLAEKKGITLPADMVGVSLEKGNKFPFDTKTSYQRDMEREDKENEGDLFGGTIVRIGRAMGIPTPVTESIYSEIENRRTKARVFSG